MTEKMADSFADKITMRYGPCWKVVANREITDLVSWATDELRTLHASEKLCGDAYWSDDHDCGCLVGRAANRKFPFNNGVPFTWGEIVDNVSIDPNDVTKFAQGFRGPNRADFRYGVSVPFHLGIMAAEAFEENGGVWVREYADGDDGDDDDE